MPRGGVAASDPGRGGVAGTDVPRDDVERRIVDAVVEDAQHRPRQLGRAPGIVRRRERGGGVQTGSAEHRGADRVRQTGRPGEVDVGGDTVAAGTGPQPPCQMLGEPPLDPGGGDRHDLRTHRIVQRMRQDVGQGVGQRVGAFGAVEDQHRKGVPVGRGPVNPRRPTGVCGTAPVPRAVPTEVPGRRRESGSVGRCPGRRRPSSSRRWRTTSRTGRTGAGP